MDSWEDKTLGDKLNSLHELPAGYSPNLSAKWEIVEAGLPDTKKRRVLPLLIRWSVAAAVLLAIGLVWVTTGEKKADSLVVKQPVIKPSTLQNQPATHSPYTERSLTSHSPDKTATIAKSKKENPTEKLAYTLLAKSMTLPIQEDTNRGGINPSPTIQTFPPIAVQQPDVAVVLEDKPRPVKKKVYQRDFNDGALAMDTGFTSTNRPHFSVQLNPFRRKASDGELPVRRLQLKQAL